MLLILNLLSLLLTLVCGAIGLFVMVWAVIQHERAVASFTQARDEAARTTGLDLSSLEMWSFKKPFSRGNPQLNTILMGMMSGDNGRRDFIKYVEAVSRTPLDPEAAVLITKLFDENFAPLRAPLKNMMMGLFIMVIGAMPSLMTLFVPA